MLYENNKPVKVTSIVISTQHSKNINQDQVKELIIPYIKKSIPESYLDGLNSKEIYINPTGQFIIGGPDGDTGLTGRKIIVDTYGGAALMVEEPFQVRTQLKLIDLQLTLQGT